MILRVHRSRNGTKLGNRRLPKGIDDVETRILEITGIPGHQPQLMMECSRGKKAVNGGGRAAHLCQEPAPAVSHRKVNRKYPPLEPCRKIMLHPKTHLLPPLSVSERLDAFANFTQCQDTHIERLTRELIEPCDDRLVRVAADRFRYDIGIEQITTELSPQLCWGE